MRILIVEDEAELCDAIAEGLEWDGYAVDRCYNGKDAYELLMVETYDLAVLDLNLPGMDGMDVLREIRSVDQELNYDPIATSIGQGYSLRQEGTL